ncbi:MAG: 4Fe-4S dicluster domain-containing protein [Firmicutes bacterium]|nr:4Fe-4S dicluster domain-containing protein [Candidatus Fermentithermobacillaceae bacterium]
MPVIETIKARCRDCYKCLRECPVKAIRVNKGETEKDLYLTVEEEICVFCGKCVTVCPQKAKRPSDDTGFVKALLKRGPVIAEVAPSFIASLPFDDATVFPALLRKLGFSAVCETAFGAEVVARAHARFFQRNGRKVIATACPAVVNLVEKHFPEVIPYLAPVASPMIVMGRYLKAMHPGARVVFIGPCVAKKDEIRRSENMDAVDVVLTYREVLDWATSLGIEFDSLPKEPFDPPVPGRARLFPAEGGLLSSARIVEDWMSPRVALVSGMDRCMDALRHFVKGEPGPDLVEMMACAGGCLAGPAVENGLDLVSRRRKLIEYYASGGVETPPALDAQLEAEEDVFGLTRASFRNRKPHLDDVPEEEIRRILAITGKVRPEDELNCGACGFPSCREKAKACYRGLADPTLCIPFMREKAESMATLVVESVPNGIVVMAEDGGILDLNPAAETLLGISRKEALKQDARRVLGDDLFLKVWTNGDKAIRTTGELNSRFVEITSFWEPAQRVVVAIFTDRTREHQESEELRRVREETARRVEQVIDRQMTVVQKIAGLLGETVAETRGSLTQLLKLIKQPEDDSEK